MRSVLCLSLRKSRIARQQLSTFDLLDMLLSDARPFETGKFQSGVVGEAEDSP